MLDFDKKIEELCSIALYEFYLTHKKDCLLCLKRLER